MGDKRCASGTRCASSTRCAGKEETRCAAGGRAVPHAASNLLPRTARFSVRIEWRLSLASTHSVRIEWRLSLASTQVPTLLCLRSSSSRRTASRTRACTAGSSVASCGGAYEVRQLHGCITTPAMLAQLKVIAWLCTNRNCMTLAAHQGKLWRLFPLHRLQQRQEARILLGSDLPIE